MNAELFSKMIGNGPDAYLLYDTDTPKTVFVSEPAYSNLFGWNGIELYANWVAHAQYVHPEDMAEIGKSFSESPIFPGDERIFDFRMTCSDGVMRHFSVRYRAFIHDGCRYICAKYTALANPAKLSERRSEALTSREKQVYLLLVQDLPFQQIAQSLNLEIQSVKNIAQRLYRKLGVSGRKDLPRSPRSVIEEPSGDNKDDGNGSNFSNKLALDESHSTR